MDAAAFTLTSAPSRGRGLLELTGVGKTYRLPGGDVVALREVDLRVDEPHASGRLRIFHPG